MNGKGDAYYRAARGVPHETIVDRLPRVADRYLGIGVLIAVGAFMPRDSLVEYAIGLIVGAVLVYLWQKPGLADVHPWYVRAWIRGAHRAHGGDSSWPISECTEPECTEGSLLLDGMEESDR